MTGIDVDTNFRQATWGDQYVRIEVIFFR
jgi:hypothetical protein